ncbi:MAG: type I-E CRISPR-associated protein Cas6/Cse3/CasE [Erysipelotrichaceae bacterium]|nr:type I-E CRISPR-associated protein Cas6/Cse3/CasE [Erysipelotrichaceae bacterium]
MYISRVEIDVNNPKKIKNLTHIGAYHSWVEDSFPEEKAMNIRTRKLWRVEKLGKKQFLMVVSKSVPNKTIFEKYGVKNTSESKDYDLFLKKIKKGNRMFFKVTLNPVICKAIDIGKRGIIKPCLSIDEQLEYIMNRAEINGFSLKPENLAIVEKGVVILVKDNKEKIKFVKAVYEGYLTVEDADKFREILTSGIGKHKAYGFGMMTVIPMV